MHELRAGEFACARALFAEIDFQRPAVYSVLEGSQPGRVYVDRPDQPTAAFIWADDCYVAGNAPDAAFSAKVGRLLCTDVMPSTENLMADPYSDAWHDLLRALLYDHGPQHIQRTTFDWDPARFVAEHREWRAGIPAGYRVARIDATIAGQVGVIGALWPSINRSPAKAFGSCVLQEDRVVSSCKTAFVGDGLAETGVETEEAHRRQGLATLACCAYLEQCLDRGVRPVWSCFYNAASEALACKLGFTNRHEMEIIYVRMPKGRWLPPG